MPESLTLYRLARSHNGVPNSAPRHLHWRTIKGATTGIVKWWTEEIEAGRGELWRPETGGLGEPRNFEFERLTYEITVDLTPRDERVAMVVCRSTWRWRTYKQERYPVTATVDGVTLEGWSAPVRFDVTEWSTAPIPDGRYNWCGPYEPTSARHIPIVAHVIEFGDEP